MSIKLKLVLSLLIQIVLIGIIILYSRQVIGKSSSLMQITYDKPLMSSNFARATLIDYLRMSKLLYAGTINKSQADDLYDSITGNLDVVEERLVTDKSKTFLNSARDMLKEWNELVKKNDLESAISKSAKIEQQVDLLIESEFSAAYDFVIEGEQGITTSNKILSVIGGTAIVLILISGFFILFSITTPISYCIKLSRKIASGDLNNKIRYVGSSEFIVLLEAFNKMQTDLVSHIEAKQQDIINKANAEREKQKKALLVDLASKLRTQVEVIIMSLDASGGHLADHASDLMFVIEDSNSRISNVGQSVNNSVEISKSVTSATENLVDSIQQISNKFMTTTSVVGVSVESANETEKLTPELLDATNGIRNLASIIEKIANQINLLALNATIESARAGEAGRGFAIVANEVKNLALQTATVTTEITEKVEKICVVIEEVINFFGSIKANISKIEQYSESVLESITEQHTTTNQISNVMHNSLNEVSKIKSNLNELVETSDMVKDASGKVHEISGLISTNTENLKKAIDSFLGDIAKD